MAERVAKSPITTPLTWLVSTEPVTYAAAMHAMDQRVSEIAAGKASELIWLLEHPPIYTAGTSAKSHDLLAAARPDIPVYETGRGGQYTYHGPGQRIIYAMLDLSSRHMDLRRYIYDLEEWGARALNQLGIKAERRSGRVGLWVKKELSEAKIAAIGVRVRKWVTLHGMAINVAPNLEDYQGIVPCGISEYGLTSIRDLGSKATMDDLDRALKTSFEDVFKSQNR